MVVIAPEAATIIAGVGSHHSSLANWPPKRLPLSLPVLKVGFDPTNFQGWTGKHPDLEVTALGPPAGQGRGAEDVGGEALRRGVVPFEIVGHKQTNQKTI